MGQTAPAVKSIKGGRDESAPWRSPSPSIVVKGWQSIALLSEHAAQKRSRGLHCVILTVNAARDCAWAVGDGGRSFG